ncbi:MAG: hypothetical protein OXB88_09215 [Bacteriovoracales bacterium]|nr:hypothetical protein [Bacteriovoracales bacterium]
MIKKIIKSFFRRIIFSSQGFPIVLSLSILGILLVLFRMKSVEQDYSINEVAKRKKTLVFKNKEFKAKKARQLSIKNLGQLAERYNLQRPKQEQIIVIP